MAVVERNYFKGIVSSYPPIDLIDQSANGLDLWKYGVLITLTDDILN